MVEALHADDGPKGNGGDTDGSSDHAVQLQLSGLNIDEMSLAA